MTKTHFRYPYGTGILRDYSDPLVHVVNDDTLRSLCGKDAHAWFRFEEPLEEPSCERCRKAVAKATASSEQV